MGELLIESIQFQNLKALRDTTLPLAPFTLLLGPNGSGKSTVLQALQAFQEPAQINPAESLSVGVEPTDNPVISVALHWAQPFQGYCTHLNWPRHGGPGRGFDLPNGNIAKPLNITVVNDWLNRVRVYSLDAKAIAQPVQLQPGLQLTPNGSGLSVVLELLRDDEPERFEALNKEVARWLPEYDRIILHTPAPGQKAFSLRTRKGGHKIPAAQLSQGTLLALAVLTLAYLPTPPSLVALEEPDRGIHPRLLRDLRDALYRLSYPKSCGETRPPVQVLVTTHSPYMLDLYREHPEEVVLAQKEGLNVQFQRLSDIPNFEEILGDSPLSEVWYSGVLGGVPTS
jgi:predicted ATPase